MVLAVGGCLLEDLGTQSVRMATAFSGGLGDTKEELCGALSGGVMVIGALHGRSSLGEDDQPAIQLANAYRDRFMEQFGYTKCGYLREKVVGTASGPESCAALVERAARVLLNLLSEAT